MFHFEFSALNALFAQIVVILLASKLLGVLLERVGQPPVIAEIFAGIALGPSILGRIWPEGAAALFPTDSLAVLKTLSQVGLVFFMFLTGLEFHPKLLEGRRSASVTISLVSIVLPFGSGVALATWLYPTHSTPDVPLLSFALFLGAAMSVTAFPVLARILAERNIANTSVGTIALACAAVDDVGAWCILAVVVAVARSQGMAQALWTCGLTVAFIASIVFLLRPRLRQLIAARVGSGSDRRLAPGTIIILLVLLLASSGASEMIGIHALFGAFLFGTILPRDEAVTQSLTEKLETVSKVMLLPLFFAYSGLRTNVGLVSQPSEWLTAIAIVACATACKFGGSAVAARVTGLNWREAATIGILMNTRGLIELIVLNIGMDLGVIAPTMFTMLVIMALVTTVATTPLSRWIYPDPRVSDVAPADAPFPVALRRSS